MNQRMKPRNRIMQAQEYLQEIKELVENPEVRLTSEFDLYALYRAKEYVKAFIRKQKRL